MKYLPRVCEDRVNAGKTPTRPDFEESGVTPIEAVLDMFVPKLVVVPIAAP